jgi:hypothetical protein
MRIFQSGKTKALLTLLLSLSILIQEGMSQTPVLTISSDPTTPGSTFYNATRTLTVSSMSTANVNDVIGYLNAGPLTIVGSSDLSVTVSSAISSTGTVNGLTIGSSGNIGTIALNAAFTLKGPVTLKGEMININLSNRKL